MSPFLVQIDRFVRWFFNVSPLTTSIEPQPEPERSKRRSSSPSPAGRARPASPKERRERLADRAESRKRHTARAASIGQGEEA